MRNFLTFSILLFGLLLCAQQLPPFNTNDQPAAPDYSLEKNWSALPFRTDAADVIPNSETWVSDSLKDADVFFIYPTIYSTGNTWTADVNDKTLNKKIDKKPIKYQASVFNRSCRVYAPRYRQAILKSFYDIQGDGKQALDFAYQDVKRAFQYYLDHYNNGRPIIIASHSQGTYHARKLLKEFFDNSPLRNHLVAAYIIGYAIRDTMYKNLKPCNTPTQTGCYITWASYKKGFEPVGTNLAGNVCVNPLCWCCDTVAIDASKSSGAILLSFNNKYENNVSAQIHNNYLWVNNSLPLVRKWNILHIADYNLFWYDIRKNVADRVKAFIKK